MKLGIDIHHVSEHCWKGFQGQRAKVKVISRPAWALPETLIGVLKHNAETATGGEVRARLIKACSNQFSAWLWSSY